MLAQWVFALKFQLYGETWFNRSETLTHSHPEEEIERGHEEERKGSPIPIFPPPILNMIGAFCIELGVLEVTGFWSIEEALNPKVSIKEVMVRFVLIG